MAEAVCNVDAGLPELGLTPERGFDQASGSPVELDHVTFVGPPVDDREILARAPTNLLGLLEQLNGFIKFQCGPHVRGACREPAWQSLRKAWLGEHAFHCLYPAVSSEGVPFAEDCIGDLFILGDDRVLPLADETRELKALDLGLAGFLHCVQADPIGFLALYPVLSNLRPDPRQRGCASS